MPVIHFGTGTATLLPVMRRGGRRRDRARLALNLDDAWTRVGHDTGVQGNLDPLVLLAEPDFIRARAKRILDQAGRPPGPHLDARKLG